MKSFSFAKALTLGCLICLALPIACGDDDDDTRPSKPGAAGAGGEPSTPEGGAGGMPALMIPGTSDRSKMVKCGSAMCSSVSTVVPTLFVDPCCADGDVCGVKTDFLLILGASLGANSCQAQKQVGPVDMGCPDSKAQKLPVNGRMYDVPGFVGCCRADTGTCGVVIDKITASGLPFSSPMLGCVDSSPFFPGQTAAACGDTGTGGGGGGAGAGAGAGGAGGMTSVAGAGGAGGAGGAAAGAAGAP